MVRKGKRIIVEDISAGVDADASIRRLSLVLLGGDQPLYVVPFIFPSKGWNGFMPSSEAGLPCWKRQGGQGHDPAVFCGGGGNGSGLGRMHI